MSPLSLPRSSVVAGLPMPRDIQPTGTARASGAGSAPYRLLAAGELFAGYGVVTHDLGLAGGVARGLASRTAHGADVEVIPGSVKDALSLRNTPSGSDLKHFDGAVLHLDRPLIRGAGRHASKLRELLAAFRLRLGRRAVVVLVIDPVDLEVARISREAFERTVHPFSRVVVLAQTTGRAAQMYSRWGTSIAELLAEELRYPQLWVDAIDELDERKRESAVAGLGRFDQEWDAAFKRMVSLVRSMYGTKSAALSVVGRGTTTLTAIASSSVLAPVPRSDSICSEVLRTYGGVIVPDARLDTRFAAIPAVVAGETRFYAGYRVCAPDGQPVAALCVFDDVPREVTNHDIAPLREFAATAERQLWQLLRRRANTAEVPELTGTGTGTGTLSLWI